MNTVNNINIDIHINNNMFVIKRNGAKEKVSFDKITTRIESLCKELKLDRIDPIEIAQVTVQGLYNGITTEELDMFASVKCAERIIDDPQYNKLAAGLCVSNLHKNTSDDFMTITDTLYEQIYDKQGLHTPKITVEYYNNVKTHIDKIQSRLNYTRDYKFDFFAIKTLEKSYLIKNHIVVNGKYVNKIVERPQHMFMRVSLSIHIDDIDAALETYDMMTEQYFTHASPTLYNSGSEKQQLSSCFLGITEVLTMNEGVKQIQNVKIGDLVVTHTGTIKKVSQIHKNPLNDRSIYKLKAKNTKEIYVTGNHRFLTLTDDNKVEWAPIDTFKPNDYIGMPNYTGTIDTPYITLNAGNAGNAGKIYIDNDIATLFGIFIGCGSIKDNVIQFRRINNIQVQCKIKRILKETFESDYEIDSSTISCMSIVLTELFNRSIMMDILGWPKELILKLLCGIIMCVGKPIKTYSNDTRIAIYVNKEYGNNLYHILRSYGIDVEYNYLQGTTNITGHELIIPYISSEMKDLLLENNTIYPDLDHTDREDVIVDGIKFIKVEYIMETCLKPGYVYTLGVDDDHSYNVEGLLCENCFLLGMDDDLDSIFDTIHDCAKISKWAGGIGIHLSDIRAKGSLIRGTGGESDGLVPLMRTFNALSRYINQGGRRNGAIACYIEPWSSDVYDFIELRKNTGNEESRARDMFLALWVPDLFMKRALNDEMWSLMCPDECPGLTTKWGDEFEELYISYEKDKKYKRQVKAKELLIKIVECQIETGMPYFCFKDAANRYSNQQNIGTIQSSNLCAEIYEYSDQNETAVCNLASICLPRFVEKDNTFNYDKLLEISKIVTKNLNKVIDVNYYPTEKARLSNMKHRPIGIGIQGLADVFCMLNIPFDSDNAIILNKKIHETIYYGCCVASNELAIKYGPYASFRGSPFSKGQLQFHMHGLTTEDLLMDYDWDTLVESIKTHGMRNSLLTAFMPTASTSQIMGNNECFEPYTTNMYTRTTQAGEFVVINQHLIETLIKNNLWTKEVRNEFMFDNGSVQKIDAIPSYIKEVYKTAFEMKIKPVVDLAIGRAPFCDQGQSMNLFCKNPDFGRVMSALFYGWKNNLKTGLYYLRSQPAVDAIKFGLDPIVARDIALKRGMPSGYTKIDDNGVTVSECEMCSG
jgi:ribonucleoside-diphosphate reductase alpha subunit